jgi:hypothetical protein
MRLSGQEDLGLVVIFLRRDGVGGITVRDPFV